MGLLLYDIFLKEIKIYGFLYFVVYWLLILFFLVYVKLLEEEIMGFFFILM